jgi:predicted chitinase
MKNSDLKVIMPNCKHEEYFPFLIKAMNDGEINTPKRQAAFIAQIAHESCELKYMQEIASGAAYEGRVDLGNVQKGDGIRFKGRGPIQLTGRKNYYLAGKCLGLNLVDNPEIAATPEIGFKIAVWFWNMHGLNSFADNCKFDDITRKINGGLNGKTQRDAYYAIAKKILGVT